MPRAVSRWVRDARELLPELQSFRAALHEEPELADQEGATREKITRALARHQIPFQTYAGFTGVLATIAGSRPGPVVALRADMDGLPITEATGLSYTSKHAGRMHACGHDVHMAALLGAGVMLQRDRAKMRGTAKLLFQPAEEEGGVGGALPFLERGGFERPRVEYVVGQHVAPEIPLGTIGWRVGPLMAAADHFKFTVQGRGGHAAYPHRGPDAILVATEIVTGLQSIISRARNPVDPAVISVGSIHGGTRHNILPEEVMLEGTVRTFDRETRKTIESQIRRRVTHLAKSQGARVKIEYQHGYPVTVNHAAATKVVVSGLERELGASALQEIAEPVMGAEDFSRYLERVPGTFLFLGVGGPDSGVSLHSPVFAPDPEAIVFGAAALAIASTELQRNPP